MFKPYKTEAKSLRRYEPDVLLDAISKTSVWRKRDVRGFEEALKKESLDYRAALRDFQLAFVAKLVLYAYDKPRLSQRRFDWKDLVQACRGVMKHDHLLGSVEEIEPYMRRVAYQQFPDFYGDNDTLARTRLLFRTCAKAVQAQRHFEIDEAFNNTTGLTVDKTWDITIALFGLLLTQKGGVQPGPIKAGALWKNISDTDIEKYLKLISLTPQDFQNKLRLPEFLLDPYETFNPNPLVSWPIIMLKNQAWVVPIVPYLFRRGTEQIYYDVIKSGGRAFAGFFGYVFEDYTDRMLSILKPGCEIIPETRYINNGQTYDTCDKIVIKDGNAILLECKTKRLSLKSKFTSDRELIRKDITDTAGETGNVVHAIRQLNRTENDIRANCHGLEELHKKITGRIYPFVLVLDPYYFANTAFFRSIIVEELNKGTPLCTGYSWQILDIREFESLCSLSRQEDLISLVTKKLSTKVLEEENMKTFLDNYIQERQIGRGILDHPVMSSELDELWSEIESRYGIKVKG